MSQTTIPNFLLESRGVSRELEAFVVAVRFSRDNSTVAFALGDGTLQSCGWRTPPPGSRCRCMTARCWRWPRTPRGGLRFRRR